MVGFAGVRVLPAQRGCGWIGILSGGEELELVWKT